MNDYIGLICVDEGWGVVVVVVFILLGGFWVLGNCLWLFVILCVGFVLELYCVVGCVGFSVFDSVFIIFDMVGFWWFFVFIYCIVVVYIFYVCFFFCLIKFV